VCFSERTRGGDGGGGLDGEKNYTEDQTVEHCIVGKFRGKKVKTKESKEGCYLDGGHSGDHNNSSSSINS